MESRKGLIFFFFDKIQNSQTINNKISWLQQNVEYFFYLILTASYDYFQDSTTQKLENNVD